MNKLKAFFTLLLLLCVLGIMHILKRILRQDRSVESATGTKTLAGDATPSVGSRRIEANVTDSFRTPSHQVCDKNLSEVSQSQWVLIHIGKTGGTTLSSLFRFRLEVHAERNSRRPQQATPWDYPHPSESDYLVIPIRDPIKRLMSAWYFHKFGDAYHRTGMKKWRCWRCPGIDNEGVGKQMPNFFSFNEFAENLDTEEGGRILDKGCLLHFCFNYHKYINYLKDWIARHPCQIRIIRQEHFAEDVWRTFNVDIGNVVKHRGKPAQANERLSRRAVSNLKAKLQTEYEWYRWLLSLQQS